MRSLGAILLLLAPVLAQDAGTVHGTILNPNGKAAAGVFVRAHAITSVRPYHRDTRTDAQGTFRFSALPVGTYVLMVLPADPAKKPRKASGLGEQIGEAISKPLTAFLETLTHEMLRTNAKDFPHRVVVAQGKTVRHDIELPKKTSVLLAFTHKGAPVRGARVNLSGLDRKGRTGWKVSVGPDPKTDGRGRITFESVPVGTYAVLIEIDAWDVGCGVIEVGGTSPVTVPIELGPYSVRVEVLDGHGKPVTTAGPGIYLQATKWHRVMPRAFTDPRSSTGIYTIPYAREGVYGAWVNANAAHARTRDISVGSDSPSPKVTLQLQATGTLVVRIVDARGKPIKGVHVRVERVREFSPGKAGPGFGYDTDEKGEVRLEHLTAEEWRVGVGDILAWKGEPRVIDLEAYQETSVEFIVADR